jgi:glucokinase
LFEGGKVILAGDVGATKILLEVGESRSGAWQTRFAQRYATHDELNFPEMLRVFLAEWKSQDTSGHGINAAAFGVAGPLQGNAVQMTHRPWPVDGELIASRLDIPKVRIVNDLAAAAHGIDWLQPEDLLEIQPGEVMAEEPRVVIGVGTGLGVAYCIRAGGHVHAVGGEGGHASFAPTSLQQAGLWHTIFATRGRVSNEDILSGTGLQLVYSYTSEQGVVLDPESISRGAIERSDQKCTEAMDLFAEILGSVAGDHALAVVARGGVYLTGGIVAKIAPWLRHGKFRTAFSGKSPHEALLASIPITAVTSERAVVLGSARFAAESL